MTKRRETWWATIDGYDDDKIVELTVEDGRPIHVHTIGTGIGIGADQLERYGVRLIERVLPAGRAAAAIERLDEIAGELWPWRVVEEISAILQGEPDGDSSKATDPGNPVATSIRGGRDA